MSSVVEELSRIDLEVVLPTIAPYEKSIHSIKNEPITYQLTDRFNPSPRVFGNGMRQFESGII